jgi:hypothetical protein
MTAVDHAKQHQATWQDGASAGTEFGTAGSQLKPGAPSLHLPPKVHAGISVVVAAPQESLLGARTLHLPPGTEQPVSSHALQLDAQAGQIGSAAPAPLTRKAATPDEAVASIVEQAVKGPDYLQALGKAYAKATPEQQQLMQANETFRGVVAKTVETATAVLINPDMKSSGESVFPQTRTDTAIENLNGTLQHLDPVFAGLVAKEAAPVFQHF